LVEVSALQAASHHLDSRDEEECLPTSHHQASHHQEVRREVLLRASEAHLQDSNPQEAVATDPQEDSEAGKDNL